MESYSHIVIKSSLNRNCIIIKSDKKCKVKHIGIATHLVKEIRKFKKICKSEIEPENHRLFITLKKVLQPLYPPEKIKTKNPGNTQLETNARNIHL